MSPTFIPDRMNPPPLEGDSTDGCVRSGSIWYYLNKTLSLSSTYTALPLVRIEWHRLVSIYRYGEYITNEPDSLRKGNKIWNIVDGSCLLVAITRLWDQNNDYFSNPSNDAVCWVYYYYLRSCGESGVYY